MSDMWLVKLPAGERKMTLDELDAAYQADVIDERTLVREPGAPWRTLGSLLGIEATHPSVRPVSIDLEVDLPPMRPKMSRAVIFGMPAAALVACGALVLVTSFHGAAPKAAAAGAAVVVAPPTITQAPVATAPEIARPVLTDTQKQALAKADEDREKKLKATKETKKAKTPPPKSKPVFTKSGNKFDPLNAKL